MKPVLYLIPSPLSDMPVTGVLPSDCLDRVRNLTYFVVEELRTARRYLSRAGLSVATLHFSELNEHTRDEELYPLLEPLRKGYSMGLISEAGLPAVADPGAGLVALAHKEGFPVEPMPGPSSLMMALMASGLNGQQFAFNGYLPVKPEARRRRIKELEKRSGAEGQTQLFIETPYRNGALMNDLLDTCMGSTRLTLAIDLTSSESFICTLTVEEWKKNKPDFEVKWHKKPCVFILQA